MDSTVPVSFCLLKLFVLLSIILSVGRSDSSYLHSRAGEDKDSRAASNNDRTLLQVRWYAPVQSGGGYCSEAIAMAKSLELLVSRGLQIILLQHGDSVNSQFLEGLDSRDLRLVTVASNRNEQHNNLASSSMVVAICHSEPGAWHAPRPHYYTNNDCPPPNFRTHYRIGRTMFETNRLPIGWVERLMFMVYHPLICASVSKLSDYCYLNVKYNMIYDCCQELRELIAYFDAIGTCLI